MPNRIIKESIRESYSVDQLAPQSEVLFYRLITYADDFGLFKGDPRLLNKALFPLKNYRDKDVILWLDDIAKSGMIRFYIGDDGKPYGLFVSWQEHQTTRNQRSKFPQPKEGETTYYDSITAALQADEINCMQLKSIAPLNPIQSVSESNPILCASGDAPQADYDAGKGKSLHGECLAWFEEFWEAFGDRRGKKPAARAWLILFGKGLPFEKKEKIISGAKHYRDVVRPGLTSRGLSPKMPEGWLTDHRWEDAQQEAQERISATEKLARGVLNEQARSQGRVAGDNQAFLALPALKN
jgi:hypothetical protein